VTSNLVDRLIVASASRLMTNHPMAPTYLAVDCLAISAIDGKRHLRSAGTGTLSTKNKDHTGDEGFRDHQVHSSGTVYQPPCKPQLSPLTFARHLKADLFV